ncbi:potassium channel family protein [Pseudobacteroides cellulosolvens]|uniref:TrkA-N domain protein n=1 Tax=Pseudobacteroides cellulosolvens ATCC 35603 = DSM 2933 TaxID=398512 RepID=A0A0L6JHB3_9FIRM|nr:TrkA family potassium uptake protein [Pseudobacteroides cellulosolvens]KNY25118.1 TrkA-N domain protein [Pseudobacteroides cellulosolvens ATCC 35603 = DSM 2933]
MQIIIIGCGKVGSKFAQMMSDEGHDVVIVDSDSGAFKSLGLAFNGLTITGVPIDQDILKQAGIETADILIALTPDDNINIMACQVAKEIFNVPKVLARIFNPEREDVFHQFGLDTICPTNVTVDVIKSFVFEDKDVTKFNIGSNLISFKREKVQEKYEGKRISSIKLKSGLFVFGIIRNGTFNFAYPSLRLNKDDTLLISEKID